MILGGVCAGEGTRADICELMKDSQYLAGGAEASLHSVVSGALDRLHYEADPCVKYDSTRKVWIYLHRHRSETQFGQFLPSSLAFQFHATSSFRDVTLDRRNVRLG